MKSVHPYGLKPEQRMPSGTKTAVTLAAWWAFNFDNYWLDNPGLNWLLDL